MFIGAAVIAIVGLVGVFLTVPLMSRPIVASREEPFFIGVDSSQVGGTLWVKVSSAKPIDVNSDEPIQLQVSVSSDEDVAPVLIFGGSASSSLLACEGVGGFIDPGDSITAFDALGTSSAELVKRYFQRRPTRAAIADDHRLDSITEDVAVGLANHAAYRTDVLELSTPETLVWDYKDEPKEEIEAHAAILTCSFEASAFFAQESYARSFRSPDVFAQIAAMNGEGPVRVQSEIQFSRSEAFNTPIQTYTNVRQYVDPDTGERLMSLTEDWWARTNASNRAVLVSSGVMLMEPRDAETWRVLARLLVGLFASLFVALSVILIRKTLYFYM